MKKLKIILLFSLLFRNIYIIKNNIYHLHYKKGNQIIQASIDDIDIDGSKLSLIVNNHEKLKVNYYFKTKIEKRKFDYELGDKLEISCELDKPQKNTNYYLFNYQNYLKSKKIFFVCQASKMKLINRNNNLFYKIKNLTLSRINNSHSKVYLKTFILGTKEDMNSGVKKSYQNNGISHLFALSGMHITLFVSILLKLFNNIKYKYFIIYIFLIFYLFLTNFSSSILRATLFFILLNLSKKKFKSSELLVLIFFLLFTYNPFYIYDLGFVFSFLVSYTLIKCQFINNIKGYIKKTFLISVISFLITTPIVINNYFEINFLGPLLNIIFVPFVSFIVFPLALLTFIFEPVSLLLNITIIFLENLSLFFDKISIFKIVLCHTNLYIMIIYYIVIILIIFKFKSKKYYYIIFYFLFIILHFCYPYIKNDYTITVIDVGQGDSILISLPHNKNILVDTGGIENFYNEKWSKRKEDYSIGTSTIIPYLKSQGIDHLDYLIITHGDFDHIGESINLINNFKVNNVHFNVGDYNNLESNLINILKLKGIKYYQNTKSLNIKNNKFYFLNKKNYNNENDNSSIIYTKLNNKNILLMGDASSKIEEYLIKVYNLPKMDILKVGHHGSKYSSSERFLKKIEPKYALISSGRNNRFNHPHDETLERLDSFNTKILITSINGMIKVKLNGKIKIYTCLY